MDDFKNNLDKLKVIADWLRFQIVKTEENNLINSVTNLDGISDEEKERFKKRIKHGEMRYLDLQEYLRQVQYYIDVLEG